jgi:hypothetical protein
VATPIQCVALDECHDAGRCHPVTGVCSHPARVDGTPCDDGDACSGGDLCLEGNCMGEPLPDSDGDGFCDVVDLCPQIFDPAQVDTDGDGISDVCQCPPRLRVAASVGRQCAYGLPAGCDHGPVTLSRQRTASRVLRCGDKCECAWTGARGWRCTFGVALCFANADPRYPHCTPSMIRRTEVLLPKAARSASPGTLANVKQFERALSALGLEVRRRGHVIAERTAPMGHDVCSPLIRLVVAAPKASGGIPVRQKLHLRALAEDGRGTRTVSCSFVSDRPGSCEHCSRLSRRTEIVIGLADERSQASFVESIGFWIGQWMAISGRSRDRDPGPGCTRRSPRPRQQSC